tara:strand:- start:699 stop:1886 length:1188 start_codon:yes stop_codon:yes gene_type:complete
MAGMSFEEYVNAYYRGGLDISKRYGIKKSDELTTADTAYFNTMYGASVFNQLNTKSDIFKLFRKEGWTQSGWRVMHKRTAAASNVGVLEGGAFGTSDVPDLKQVSADIKEIVSPYTVSTRAAILAEADDGVKGLATFLRAQAAEAHSFYIDKMLVEKVGTPAVNNMESLQRIVADNDLVGLTAVSATDVDIYDIDRSETGAAASNEDSWANAYVDHGTISSNETARDLSLSQLDTMIQNAIENGAAYGDLILLTGYQQLTELKQLITAGTSNATWRMALESQAPKGTNGVQSEPGMNLDARVGYYDSIPIYASQHIDATIMDNQVASGGTKTLMGPVFLLDMSSLYLKIAAPTTFLAQEDLANVQALKRNYAFMTAGEIICTKFKTQGILRGLEF